MYEYVYLQFNLLLLFSWGVLLLSDLATLGLFLNLKIFGDNPRSLDVFSSFAFGLAKLDVDALSTRFNLFIKSSCTPNPDKLGLEENWSLVGSVP